MLITNTAAALLIWQAAGYSHFTATVKREHLVDTVTRDLVCSHIKYVFVCLTDPDNCRVHRKQKNTGRDGTQNLRRAIRRCNAKHQISDSLAIQYPVVIPYSHLMFHVLLVVWCVVSYWPFHTVADPLFLDIVHMLRPNVVVPTPHTLSSDLSYIFNLASVRICDNLLVFFNPYLSRIYADICVCQQMETGAHIAIDGWSNPLTALFPSVVIFWRSGSTTWRSVSNKYAGLLGSVRHVHCLLWPRPQHPDHPMKPKAYQMRLH